MNILIVFILTLVWGLIQATTYSNTWAGSENQHQIAGLPETNQAYQHLPSQEAPALNKNILYQNWLLKNRAPQIENPASVVRRNNVNSLSNVQLNEESNILSTVNEPYNLPHQNKLQEFSSQNNVVPENPQNVLITEPYQQSVKVENIVLPNIEQIQTLPKSNPQRIQEIPNTPLRQNVGKLENIVLPNIEHINQEPISNYHKIQEISNTPLHKNAGTHNVLSNPKVLEAWKTVKQNKRYTVIYPDGTVSQVDNVDSILEINPHHVFVDPHTLSNHASASQTQIQNQQKKINDEIIKNTATVHKGVDNPAVVTIQTNKPNLATEEGTNSIIVIDKSGKSENKKQPIHLSSENDEEIKDIDKELNHIPTFETKGNDVPKQNKDPVDRTSPLLNDDNENKSTQPQKENQNDEQNIADDKNTDEKTAEEKNNEINNQPPDTTTDDAVNKNSNFSSTENLKNHEELARNKHSEILTDESDKPELLHNKNDNKNLEKATKNTNSGQSTEDKNNFENVNKKLSSNKGIKNEKEEEKADSNSSDEKFSSEFGTHSGDKKKISQDSDYLEEDDVTSTEEADLWKRITKAKDSQRTTNHNCSQAHLITRVCTSSSNCSAHVFHLQMELVSIIAYEH